MTIYDNITKTKCLHYRSGVPSLTPVQQNKLEAGLEINNVLLKSGSSGITVYHKHLVLWNNSDVYMFLQLQLLNKRWGLVERQMFAERDSALSVYKDKLAGLTQVAFNASGWFTRPEELTTCSHSRQVSILWEADDLK